MGARGWGVAQRPLNAADLEKRERIARIRAAARKGKTPAEIVELCHAPLEAVRQALASVEDSRLSDPVRLLRTRQASPETMPADVQLYWLGFLTAAGHIYGQGASSTLIITLGERSQADMETFMADVADPHVRYEFCRSSLAGWQLYVRDQGLCKALIPWGIPSDLYGGDPALLDDLPEEFVVPFLRGYVDGNQSGRPGSNGGAASGIVLYGTPAVLTGINRMVQRCWSVGAGAVTEGARGAELRFPDRRTGRMIWGRVHAYPSRLRLTGAESFAG